MTLHLPSELWAAVITSGAEGLHTKCTAVADEEWGQRS